jgi:hypothetical protein
MARINVRTVLLWIVNVLASLAFVAIGAGKFFNPFWLKAFPRWGYSDGFRILIGVLEIAAGVFLAIPATAMYAAVLIDAILSGALATLVLNHEKPFPPVFWLVVVSAVGFARRRRAWRPSARPVSTPARTI